MKPRVRTRVAFESSPLVQSPSWFDISKWVYIARGNEVEVNYGRPDEFSQVQPSRLTLNLDNSDGRFTPGRAASPYYPNVTKGKRIRVDVRGQFNDGSFVDDANWIFNPGGETVAGGFPSGWQTFGAGIVASISTLAETGTYGISFAVNHTGGTPAGIGSSHEGNLLSELTPGRRYTISFRCIKSAAPSRPIKIRVQWYSSPTSGVTQTDYSDAVMIGGSWTTVSGTFTAPDEVWKAKVAAYVEPADCVNGEVWDTDTWRMDEEGHTYSTTTLVTTDPDTVYKARYDGFVDQWPQVWTSPSANLSESRLVASDRQARLGRAAAWSNIIELEYFLDRSVAPSQINPPYAYWALGDGSDATEAAQSGSSSEPGLVPAQVGTAGTGTVTFGAGTGPTTDGLSAVQFLPFDQVSGKYLGATTNVPLLGSSQWSLEWFFAAPNTGFDRVMINVRGHLGTAIYLSAAGKVVLEQFGAAIVTSALSYNDDSVHHVAVVLDGAGTATVYVDGASVGSGSLSPDNGTDFRVGAALSAPFQGTMAHLALHEGVSLTSTVIADHHAAGTTAFEGETTDERMQRLGDYALVADKWLETGVTTSMTKLLTHGKTPLQLMRETEVTENGLVFFSRIGELTFQGRDHRYNATPWEIYDVAAGDVEEGLLFIEDDTSLVNEAVYSQPEGVTQKVRNQESIALFDRYNKTETLYTTDPNEVLAAAQWVVNQRGTPQPRCPTVAVDMRTQDGVMNTLEIELGDMIRLTNLPDQAPAAEMDMFVEGYHERISEEAWTITLNCTPADAETVWVLDSSTLSVLGTSTRLAY